MASTGAERRRDKRLDLALPVQFAPDPQAAMAVCNGVTHNVSSSGVYFEAVSTQLAADDSLLVRIGIPGHSDENKPNLTLVGTGVVRRIEPLTPDQAKGTWPELHRQKGIYGIAVQFEQRPTIQLRSFEELLWEDHPH